MVENRTIRSHPDIENNKSLDSFFFSVNTHIVVHLR